jgi:hypothetical protein
MALMALDHLPAWCIYMAVNMIQLYLGFLLVLSATAQKVTSLLAS